MYLCARLLKGHYRTLLKGILVGGISGEKYLEDSLRDVTGGSCVEITEFVEIDF